MRLQPKAPEYGALQTLMREQDAGEIAKRLECAVFRRFVFNRCKA